MASELLIPKLGLTMTQGTITEWSVPSGSEVSVGDVLYVLTTDKTVTDIEAEEAGVLHHGAAVGTTLAPGDIAGWICEVGEDPPSSPTEATPAAAGSPSPVAAPDAAAPAGSPAAGGRIVASPYARRLASERGIDLAGLVGSGPGGRIVADDVPASNAGAGAADADAVEEPDGLRISPLARRLAGRLGIDPATIRGSGPGGRIVIDDVVAVGSPPSIGAPASAGGPDEPRHSPGDRLPLTPMRRVIATRMHESLQQTAQLTLHREVDAGPLLDLRARLKADLAGSGEAAPSVTDLVVKASAMALLRHPLLNSSLVDDEIVIHDVVDVGVAVAVPDGLLVPVVRSADELPVSSIGSFTRALAERARSGRLTPADLEGSTFTVSSLGAAGIDMFTPILNSPNVAILGVGRSRETVRWQDGEPVPGSVLGLSLTIDHRVVDGAPGAEFLAELADLLASPLRLLVA